MESKGMRGSQKLLAAWKTRALSEESVKEIAAALEKSPATVEGANVFGGSSASGLTLSLSYADDDIPSCGNDISFWLNWLRRHGGTARPPRVIINGTPFPDLLKVVLDFGHVASPSPEPVELGDLAGGRSLGG